MESISPPTLLATDHDLFVGDLIDQMRKHRLEKSRSYRHLPYFQHLGSDEVFEALERVKQANLLQMQLKMQKDCSYLQHMDDMSLEGRNAESVRKRVQEGKLQGGFRQMQSQGHTTVCGCLDCQLRLGNKQFNSSFQYEQNKEALAQKTQRSRLSLVGAAWHNKPMLAMHLAHEGETSDVLGRTLHVAVLKGDAELVKLLCSRGECGLHIAWGGVSSLDLAVAKGFEDGGDVLLQHGAPLKHFQHESLTEACERGSMLLLKALLQQLGIYSHHGRAEVLNCTNTEGNTALHVACLLPEREAAVKILVAHNCEPNKENADGMTPLDCCVQASNRNAWRALRHATGGQAKYRRYEAEQRSLRAAVASNCYFLVRNVHLRQDGDRKAEKPRADLGDILHLAAGTAGVGDDMVQYLVEQGADVNVVKDGMSVLDLCLRENNVNESILGRHARLRRYQDYTVFRAAQEGLPGLVRHLVTTTKKSGKAQRQDGINHREGGCLPVHVAAHRGHVEVVKVLLKSNNNVHEQTNEGKTALDLACMALERLPGGDNPTAPSARKAFIQVCRTIDALLSRGARLKECRNDGMIARAREAVQRDQEATKREAQEQKERDELRNETRRQLRRQREEGDDVLRHVERDIRSAVADDERKAEAYKESEKLAKRVAESREILQASWKGEGEKLPEYLSSKYYQIRIDVLRRKMQEKDQQIEEALKKMDFAEEDYLWLLRKKMRDLRLKYHPDKITDRSPTEDDYKFYERITKAYDVLCLKEERDKYLEMSNHVEWLQQHGEEEEARLVEKAIYDMETQKKVKKPDDKKEESAQPPKEHVERAKRKLQERRDEDTWENPGDKIKALTLGTPNKCKAPVVTAQRFAERLEQCWIDIEWVCKCAFASAERIEYELRVQAIDKGSQDWAEVYHGWESSVAGLGPFPVGAYEFMVRARNSIGWGEWSDVAVVALDDPKWERQQKREADQQVLREQAKSLQWDLEQVYLEFRELQDGNKLTIHRASNLLFRLQAELKRARIVRSHLPRPEVFREAEAAVQVLEKWRDRKEAFAEWKNSISEMKNEMLRSDDPQRASAVDGRGERCDLAQFLGQDEHYFGSLRLEIRNLIVQTLLSLDSKQVFKKLMQAQKDLICSALRRSVELGKAAVATGSAQEDLAAKEKPRTIFTKHQTDLLQRLADRFSTAQCRTPTAAACAERFVFAEDREATPDTAAEAAAATATLDDAAHSAQTTAAEDNSAAAEKASTSACSEAGADDRVRDQEKPETKLRTVHVVGLPHRERVSRGDLLGALRLVAEVDGAFVGTTDALVRFSSADAARAALHALEQGVVALRRSILSGFLATSNTLTEEALLEASAKAAPQQRPVAPVKAVPRAVTTQASQQQQQQQKSQQSQPQPAPAAVQQEHPQTPAVRQLPQQQPQSQQMAQASPQHARKPVAAAQSLQSLPQDPVGACHWGGSAPSASPTSTETTPDVANVDTVPRISMDQLVQSDTSSIQMFECPLCSGLSRQPKITMCCQKVFCGQCLDRWLRTSTCCPSCSTSVVHRDGSTGGCTEASVTKVDSTSTGVQGVLWRVYGGIRIRCPHEQCNWSGGILKYAEHLASCAFEARVSFPPRERHQPPERHQPASVLLAAPGAHGYPGPQSAPAAAREASAVAGAASSVACGTGCGEGAIGAAQVPEPVGTQVVLQPAGGNGSTCYEVVHHHAAADSTQMTLALGDRVFLTQIASNGWAYGRKAVPGQDAVEGWFPTFCLPADRDKPPRPQQAPPPSLPPAGSTQVHRDYAASDPSQLTVKEGELVHIRSRDPSGWTFVSRVMPSTMSGGKREGWIPEWLLTKDSS